MWVCCIVVDFVFCVSLFWLLVCWVVLLFVCLLFDCCWFVLRLAWFVVGLVIVRVVCVGVFDVLFVFLFCRDLLGFV